MIGDSWQRLAHLVQRIGADPADTDDLRLQKRLLVAISLMVMPAAFVWGGIYLGFDEPIAAALPLSYMAVSIVGVVFFALTRRFYVFRFSQLLAILLTPFLLMVVLGGFVNGSAVILWSLLSPLGAMLFAGLRQALGWSLGFLGLLAIGAALDPFARSSNNLPSGVVIAFFVMNISAVSAVALILLQYFIKQLEQERGKSERLLLNVLPKEVASVLKEDHRTIADQFDQVSILFADIVGSTKLAVRLTPSELVDTLNDVFSYFDSLVEKYSLGSRPVKWCKSASSC